MKRVRASRFLAQISVAVLLVFLSAVALGELPLSKRLIKSMLFGEQLESGREECQKKASAIDVAAIQARNPALFLGIDPSSPIWPKVETAYIQYVKQICLPASIGMYSERAENIYSSRLSSAELQATVDFLESSAGQKFTMASAEVTRQINEVMSIEAESVQANAWKEYEGRVLKLREDELSSEEVKK